MYARVARFENGDPESLRQSAAEIRSEAESGNGPPPGVPAKGLMLLQDPAGGKTLAIAFFENEEDYRQGDETLNGMSPPGGGLGERAAVERYEVTVQVEA